MGEATQRLTPKQRRFLEAYLGEAGWNAAKAARIAGYPERTARSIGCENLTKPDIRAAIDERLAEAAMTANEVLGRLADQARGSVEDFAQITEDGSWRIDLKKAEELGKLHLLHELGFTEHGPKIKLYDAQTALAKLGTHYKLFTERRELTGADGAPLIPSSDDLRKLPPDELLRLHRETLGVSTAD